MIDINNLSGQELHTLAQLRNMQRLPEVVEKIASQYKDALVHADDMVRIHRLQGRVEVLEALVAAIHDAAKILERKQTI